MKSLRLRVLQLVDGLEADSVKALWLVDVWNAATPTQRQQRTLFTTNSPQIRPAFGRTGQDPAMASAVQALVSSVATHG